MRIAIESYTEDWEDTENREQKGIKKRQKEEQGKGER
jgi:hypothetical protein